MPRNGTSKLEVTVAMQRRAQIMRAVMACIAEEGLERTTMRNVAERAGVSTGALGYYFKSKMEMVDAALLEASRQYMERFYRQDAERGRWSLDRLVEIFLARENADAGFVLRMIEVGLHDTELRGIHDWMIETGRARIEESLRAGAEQGRFRADVDPKLAAALLHGVLIWWGSELASNATTQDLARQVGKLALGLLENPQQPGSMEDRRRAPMTGSLARATTVATIRELLRSDERLSAKAADALSDAFERLYMAFQVSDGVVNGASGSE